MINNTKNPKKDQLGRWRTNSLFKEFANKKYKHYWTLPKLKEIYLSYEHIPHYEYEFALEHIGEWEHWDLLSNNSQLAPVIAQWRDELEVKINAKAITTLFQQATGKGASATTAAKYLAEKGYISKRGRPSKEEVTRQTKIETRHEKALAGDAERVLGTQIKEKI